MLPNQDCDQAIPPDVFQRIFVDENWSVHLIGDEVVVVFGRELAFKAVLKDGKWEELGGHNGCAVLGTWSSCYELIHDRVLDMLCSSSGLTSGRFYSRLCAAFSPVATLCGGPDRENGLVCGACRLEGADSILLVDAHVRCSKCNYSIIGLPLHRS